MSDFRDGEEYGWLGCPFPCRVFHDSQGHPYAVVYEVCRGTPSIFSVSDIDDPEAVLDGAVVDEIETKARLWFQQEDQTR